MSHQLPDVAKESPDESITSFIRRLRVDYINGHSDFWQAFCALNNLAFPGWIDQYDDDVNEVTWPYPRTVLQIGNGHCQVFARLIANAFPGAEVVDLDPLFLEDPRTRDLAGEDNPDVLYTTPGHFAVNYQGRYHDAENPEGVTDWLTLDFMLDWFDSPGTPDLPESLERCLLAVAAYRGVWRNDQRFTLASRDPVASPPTSRGGCPLGAPPPCAG